MGVLDPGADGTDLIGGKAGEGHGAATLFGRVFLVAHVAKVVAGLVGDLLGSGSVINKVEGKFDFDVGLARAGRCARKGI